MKQTILFLSFLVVAILFTTQSPLMARGKDPVMVEITTNYKTIKEALIANKAALIKEKFIPTNGMQESSFTATRTTGSKSDYYTADVMAEESEGKIKVTITFIKSGSGMLKLQKVADEIKAELNGSQENHN